MATQTSSARVGSSRPTAWSLRTSLGLIAARERLTHAPAPAAALLANAGDRAAVAALEHGCIDRKRDERAVALAAVVLLRR